MIPVALIRKTHLTSRRLWSLVLAGIVGIAALGLIAPLIDASRYGERIRQTLEATLGRPVQFEAVHFTLFSGPGFSLEGVTIGEDRRYGVEPFAYVPEMQVRVRPDKLFFRQIQISSLRLIEPSLNLVKRGDGTWNAVELVQRLSTPRRMPLNFFPVFEVQRGRLDFKFGTRKTTLYLLNADFQVFPERSNTLSISFSGSPARTDRAGNGFGHLHGNVSWILNRRSEQENQIDADLVLDPSNLSEITTLIEGHDVGVHGTVSSHARVHGLLSALRVQGQMHLGDVHRWDLLPANGNEWQVRYGGDLDLVADRLSLKTLEEGSASPVSLQMVVDRFLTNPRISLMAHLMDVPADQALPLARRMGLAIPANLALTGSLKGDVTLANQSGLAGSVSLENVVASLPGTDPLHADHIDISLVDDRMLFRPTEIGTTNGALRVAGEVWLDSPRLNTSVTVASYPLDGLKLTLGAWLGSPEPLGSFAGGLLSGTVGYSVAENSETLWSGKLEVESATVRVAGLGSPLTDASGRVSFNGQSLEVTRFSAMAADRPVQATYRYNPKAKRAERLHLDMATMELGQLEDLLTPTVQGQGWLARLGMTARPIPAWLANRDLDADITIQNLLNGDVNIGSFSSQLTWQGANLRFASLRLKTPVCNFHGHGTASLTSYRPRCSFTGSVEKYPWRGGTVDATGELETSGLGEEALRNLRALGTLTGTNLQLNSETSLPSVTSAFQLSYGDGWPNLRLSNVEAADSDGDWGGAGASQSDGRIVLDLERAGQQRRIVSALSDAVDSPALVAHH